MNSYTPTTDEVREEFIYGHQELDMDGNVVVSFDEAQVRWDRWLAEVERAAAEKALAGFADEESAAAQQLLDTMPGVMVGASKTRWRMQDEAYERNRSAVRLRARAEAYRQERKEQ